MRATQQVLLTALALCALLAAPAAAKQNRGGRVTLAPTSRPTRSPTAAPTKPPTTSSSVTPTKTAPVSTPTAPVSTPTAPVSTPTAPVSTPTAPVSTPTAPVSTPTAPVSTPTAPAGPPTTSAPATTVAGKWNPLPPPAGEKCEQPRTDRGRPAESRGYPGSMFVMTPFVFKNEYQPMKRATPTVSYFDADTGLTMAAYNMEIKEFFADAGFTGTPCAGKSIPSLGYAVAGQEATAPGPLVFSAMGQQDLMRFANKVLPNSTYFPPGGPKNSGHGTDGDICKSRPQRVVGATAGTGRGFSVHHHGMASLPAFDGWADQYFCYGETKDYVLPNNRHATQYYHDHAVGITSENAYNGLVGMRVTRPCAGDDPFKIEALEQHELLLSDMSLAPPDRNGKCRRLYNRLEEHEDNLFGDINMVNGVPWPVMSVKAKYHRFRVLNSSPSRPYIIQVRDDYGKEVGSQVCHIVGADGGIVPRPIAMPPAGLMTDIAYRWDIVCDLSGYSGRTLYLYNQPDSARTTSETPFFCYSHLIMKIKVGDPAVDPVKPKLQFGPEDGVLETNVALSASYLASLMERALSGSFDRSLKFGHSSGVWQVNDKGWEDDETHIDFDDVGQNNVELWSLESGGGWIHPVHIHMIDGFCVAIKEDGGALKPCAPELFNVPKDVIHIGANVRQIIFAARYGPHLGNYMMHCHNVVHEDHDMLRAFLVVNATKGLTFSDTPEFENELLAASSGQPEQYRADSQSTTYDAAHVGEYPLDKEYLKQCIQKNYYQIFYPPKLVNGQPNPLRERSKNMWLTTCGIQEPPQEAAPENPGGNPGVLLAGRK